MFFSIPRRVLCPIFTVFCRRSQAGRHGATPSWLWTNFCVYYPLDSENIPTLTSLGSNLGGMLLLWWLSSVQLGWWGCRMNPDSGRPITVAPSPLKGERKKERSEAAEGYINTASIARGYDSVLVTYLQRHDFQIQFVFYLFYYKALCNFVLN